MNGVKTRCSRCAFRLKQCNTCDVLQASALTKNRKTLFFHSVHFFLYLNNFYCSLSITVLELCERHPQVLQIICTLHSNIMGRGGAPHDKPKSGMFATFYSSSRSGAKLWHDEIDAFYARSATSKGNIISIGQNQIAYKVRINSLNYASLRICTKRASKYTQTSLQ